MKEDDQQYPVIPIPEGVKIGSTGKKDTYQYITYYSLKDNEVVMTIDKALWDISFTCLKDSLQILLNSANFMYCANSGNTNFDQVTSTSGLKMNFDPSSGNQDSLAFGKWYKDSLGIIVSKREVFVVDRGIDIDGNSLGFKKFQILNFSNDQFTVRFANLNGTNEISMVISKEANKNFTGLSMSGNGSLVTIEPDRMNWDIVLGQYTTLLYSGNDPYPYIVSGALSNPNSVTALELNNTPFETFKSEHFANYTLTNRKDAIGYLWKTYSLSEGKYTIIKNLTYLIKGVEGSKYKFRFLDFYDQNGNKGFPTFEYQRLL
jgi:hypothetical protein